MNPKHIVCLALVLNGALFHCTRALAAQTFASSRYGFQLDVPDGWSARETFFSFAHYSDVFLTVNNQRPDLEIHDWPTSPNTREFGPKTTFEQMQPGEVYVSVGYSIGPGGTTLRRDTVGSDLKALLATNGILPSFQSGLSGLNLRFFKRGHWWFVSVNMREPVTEQNRRQVMAMLNSLRFVAAPVANDAWAESLAWNELPQQIQMPAPELWSGWPTVDGVGTEPQTAMCGERKVVVQRADGEYAVQFTLMGIGTWEYSVSTHGGVQAKAPAFDAISVPASRWLSDLPGENKAKVDAHWVAPYVQAIAEFGKRTLIWFSKDGSIKRQTAISDFQPGFVFISGQPETIQGVNEDWQIKLPREPDVRLAGYITSTADSRIFVHERHPKLGLIALDIYIHGKRVNTVGPFPQYLGQDVVLNDDGSAAFLTTKTNTASDAPKPGAALRDALLPQQQVHAQVITLDTNGRVRFKTDCGPAVWSPIVAPDGAGVLLRPNTGGTNQNTFVWLTAAGQQHSLEISPNPEFLGWIPGTSQSLFSTSIGFQSGPCKLIDWNTGKTLWSIPSPGEGDVMAIGITPEFIFFSMAAPFPSGEWRKVNESLLQSGEPWVRTVYAVNVRDGKLAARWRGQFPHRWFDAHRDYFLRLGDKLFYVTAAEFTEINNEDIRTKRNGWE